MKGHKWLLHRRLEQNGVQHLGIEVDKEWKRLDSVMRKYPFSTRQHQPYDCDTSNRCSSYPYSRMILCLQTLTMSFYRLDSIKAVNGAED